MSAEKKLFVVVDPTHTEHVALQRALISCQRRSAVPDVEVPDLYVFVGIDASAVDTRACNDDLFKDQFWFEDTIRKPLESAQIRYKIEISWSSEWQAAIRSSAKRFGADSIFLPVPQKLTHRRFTFSDNKWDLFKSAHCPVVLVRPGAKEERRTILAAVNFQAQRDVQRELNDKILARGRLMADVYQGQFHVVNAYRDSLNYPDRGKLARETGLEPDNIHVKQGFTDEVVSEIARELKADLVIIGTLGQNGMTSNRRGNTAERVIVGLDSDVVVVNHE